MNIVVGDKMVLTNELGRMALIGETFEVAGMTEDSVVLRDMKSGSCICSVHMDNFDKHFKKHDEVKGWSKWSSIMDSEGNICAFYRSRPEKGKVEVKLADGMTELNKSHGVRCSATCSQGDTFNLEFGIRLAMQRCFKKQHERNVKILEESVEYYRTLAIDSKNKINAMIADWYGEYVKEHERR